jgi:hypothetical protein
MHSPFSLIAFVKGVISVSGWLSWKSSDIPDESIPTDVEGSGIDYESFDF